MLTTSFKPGGWTARPVQKSRLLIKKDTRVYKKKIPLTTKKSLVMFSAAWPDKSVLCPFSLSSQQLIFYYSKLIEGDKEALTNLLTIIFAYLKLATHITERVNNYLPMVPSLFSLQRLFMLYICVFITFISSNMQYGLEQKDFPFLDKFHKLETRSPYNKIKPCWISIENVFKCMYIKPSS